MIVYFKWKYFWPLVCSDSYTHGRGATAEPLGSDPWSDVYMTGEDFWLLIIWP